MTQKAIFSANPSRMRSNSFINQHTTSYTSNLQATNSVKKNNKTDVCASIFLTQNVRRNHYTNFHECNCCMQWWIKNWVAASLHRWNCMGDTWFHLSSPLEMHTVHELALSIGSSFAYSSYTAVMKPSAWVNVGNVCCLSRSKKVCSSSLRGRALFWTAVECPLTSAINRSNNCSVFNWLQCTFT